MKDKRHKAKQIKTDKRPPPDGHTSLFFAGSTPKEKTEIQLTPKGVDDKIWMKTKNLR